MFTKPAITVRDPARYSHLKTKLQQIKLQKNAVQKMILTLIGTYPISLLDQVDQKKHAYIKKRKQQYNRTTQRNKQQQHKNLKVKKLKMWLAQKQQELHQIKEEQKHMEAQPTDAPLGDQFIKFYSTQQQKRTNLKQKKTREKKN